MSTKAHCAVCADMARTSTNTKNDHTMTCGDCGARYILPVRRRASLRALLRWSGWRLPRGPRRQALCEKCRRAVGR